MKDKRNLMILILGLMAFLANGDNYAAAPLLINIAADLNLSINTASLSVTSYMLFFGIFTLILGPLSDRFGKVKIINICAFGTSIFSILGGFAFNLTSLIIFRSINGAFGAGIFPVTMALIGQSFDNENRHKALTKVMGLMFLGAATATAIGGALAYFGSWRWVYIAYGIGELIFSFIIMFILKKDEPVNKQNLNILKIYKEPLKNFSFMSLALVIMLVGFAVFGTFTFSGELLTDITGYNIFYVGLILSLFGIGTVIGGRLAPKLKKLFKGTFLVVAGILASISLLTLSLSGNIWLLGTALFVFGVAFISLQSTLVNAAQERMPNMRGTAMSVTSFNIFAGGAIGTALNGILIKSVGISSVYMIASVVILAAGILASVFIKLPAKIK